MVRLLIANPKYRSALILLHAFRSFEQLRRQTRLRREFLYTKSLEQKEKQIWERKQRVKDLLAKGKEVPRGQGTGDREQRMDETQDGEFGQGESACMHEVGTGSALSAICDILFKRVRSHCTFSTPEQRFAEDGSSAALSPR